MKLARLRVRVVERGRGCHPAPPLTLIVVLPSRVLAMDYGLSPHPEGTNCLPPDPKYDSDNSAGRSPRELYDPLRAQNKVDASRLSRAVIP
jgi:hypothetical protein